MKIAIVVLLLTSISFYAGYKWGHAMQLSVVAENCHASGGRLSPAGEPVLCLYDKPEE